MLAGEQGTGKTTIARYLIGKGPTKIRISTDGIDLYNGLSFIDRETEEWMHGKQDFTLSEVTISRSLRQSKDTSTKVLGIDNPSDQDENSLDKRVLTQYKFETFPSVADASANRNPYSKNIPPSEQLCFDDTVHTKRDATLVAQIPDGEELQGDEYCTISTKTDQLSVQSNKLQDIQSTNVDDIEPPCISEITLGRKQTKLKTAETLSAAFQGGSTEVKLQTSNTIIPSLPVIHGNNTDRFEERVTPTNESSLPVKEKEELSHSGFTTTNFIESTKLSVSIPKLGESHLETDIGFPERSITSEVIRNPGIIGKLQKLFGVKKDVKEIKVSMTKEKFWEESVKAGKKKLHQMKIAPVIIWDFGGQDVFYSTHQTFLTYRAIYLIVLDGSRNLDDPCPFAQYLPGKSGRKTARDYLRFWINTIVTYCKGSGPGFPKIMIVLTHKDKLKALDVEPKRQQLFHDIEQMFSGSSLLSHLVIKDKIFVNARNKHDPEMTKIKKIIIEQAMEQPTWGQKLPKCFIPLKLEFDSLLNRNIPLITMEHMQTINNVQPVRPLTEEELKVFLKFQHSVGRILYFDEVNLDQHIILAPTHMIDAFKSIVTDRRFCEDDRLRQDSWDLMSQKGVIGKKTIEEIWKKNKYKKFQEHKEYLLGVMTHLDILVEPKRYDTSHKRILAEFYYIASMVRTKDTTGYLESPNFSQRNISIAFSSLSSMIPPALSFRFVSYCLSLFAVKRYGQEIGEMLFHMSAVFTIDPSLDMCVNCDDDIIVVRLVHSTNRALIMRDLASSIRECLAVALEKISQLYVKTSSTGSVTGKASFSLSLCCSSPVDPCLLSMCKLQEQDDTWICPKHGIEHTKDVLSSWALQKEEIQCGMACPATDTEFLKQFPTDIHLRRLSMQYSVNETKELAIHLGMQFNTWERLYETFGEEPERLNFEILRRCLNGSNITFNEIRKAVKSGKIQNPHTLCKVVRGQPIDFDQEPEKWDLVPSEEHFDKLAPLVGNNSLAFLVELGMEFATWEHIRFKQNDRDLVKLNRDILQEWKTTFCSLKTIRPSLRHIGQAFNNIGKNIKIVENVLTDFF
ncbi:uncharacterized protein LOC127718253 [Mytilus californianus]|uniref:uncharacterized protein LOC127718253 n=1 Tax=Mytilus californianus TaxID=6549 RepID=UPI0022459108|nr:uncharacterized protein LOC127718253 [Mytilus californianus]